MTSYGAIAADLKEDPKPHAEPFTQKVREMFTFLAVEDETDFIVVFSNHDARRRVRPLSYRMCLRLSALGLLLGDFAGGRRYRYFQFMVGGD